MFNINEIIRVKYLIYKHIRRTKYPRIYFEIYKKHLYIYWYYRKYKGFFKWKKLRIGLLSKRIKII